MPPKSQTQEKEKKNQQPPPGYPNENNADPGKKCCPRFRKKGDRGFIEGCIFALCCCWLCEECS